MEKPIEQEGVQETLETQKISTPQISQDRQKERADLADQIERDDHSLDEAEAQIHRELLMENPDLSKEDLKAITDSLAQIAETITPEMKEYILGALPRIQAMLDQSEKLKTEGQKKSALHLLSDFLAKEETEIAKISNPQLKESLMAFVANATNLSESQADLDELQKEELYSNGINLIPVVGSCKMIYESARGQTSTGKQLDSQERVWQAAEGALFLALDGITIASLIPSGGTSAVAGGGAKAGISILNVGKKGAQAAKTISRLAAWTRKVTKLRGASKAIFKLSRVISKNPKIFGALIALAESKKENKQKIFQEALKKSQKKTESQPS